MRKNILRNGVAALTLLCATGLAVAEPAKFDSPEAAVEAILAALDARDREALLTVFGTENEDVVFTGDEDEDAQLWTEFLKSYGRQHRIEMADGDAILHIGREDWPFPVAIVNVSGAWQFDGAGAREEVLMRRIGLNELDVIDVLKTGVEIQAEFRQADYDGDGVMEFAAGILSSPGQRDGLYWPDEPGTQQSPIGPHVARASADGYNFDGTDEAPDPYLGYYFRVLQKQGPAAPGGALDYMIGGNMVAGHAFLAYPADYGQTGIMSFMVGENGVIYEADLGEDTLAVGNAMDSFNPGEGWTLSD